MSETRNKVRIIGGEHRRRLLSFPSIDGLRPTPDRVRETLFNWLGQELYGKTCLDLFAGSGALGFEAASRYAKTVVMVEKSRQAAQSLENNRRTLQAQNIEIKIMDALAYLKSQAKPFDVIFLDPPYATDLLAQVLPLIKGCLTEDGLVYAEARTWPDDMRDWEILKSGKAGQANYLLMKPASIED